MYALVRQTHKKTSLLRSCRANNQTFEDQPTNSSFSERGDYWLDALNSPDRRFCIQIERTPSRYE